MRFLDFAGWAYRTKAFWESQARYLRGGETRLGSDTESQMLLQFAQDYSPSILVDVGCGVGEKDPGLLLKTYRDNHHLLEKLYCIDIAENNVRAAEAYIAQNFRGTYERAIFTAAEGKDIETIVAERIPSVIYCGVYDLQYLLASDHLSKNYFPDSQRFGKSCKFSLNILENFAKN